MTNQFRQTILELLLAVGLALALLLPATAAGNDKIAYSSRGSIHVVNSDGSGDKVIASGGNNGSESTEPTFSPDGTRVAFVYNSRPGIERMPTAAPIGQIFIADADGTDLRALISDENSNHHPVFSPDGLKLAYTSFKPNSPEIQSIHIMSLVGSILTTVPNTAGAGEATFSPDGTQIAFEKNNQIFIVNVDGSGLRLLTDGNGPTWSRTGKLIAFSQQVPGTGTSNRQVHTIAPDGSNRKQIGNLPRESFQPSFSPDGSKIAFVSNSQPPAPDTAPGDGMTIHVMSADGSNLTGGLTTVRAATEPSWSGNGNYVPPNSPITKATQQTASAQVGNQILRFVTPTRGCLKAGTADIALRVKAKRHQRKTGKRLVVKGVWFYVDNTVQIKDNKKPYGGKLQIQLPAGTAHTFRAQIFYTLAGSKKQRSKNLVRKFKTCS